MSTISPFSSLPTTNPGPPYNAWGLYGSDDELGRLNLITPECIKRGKETITEGRAVNLNLPLSFFPAFASRKPLDHTILCRGHCNDDEVAFNTQATTQWDGFRHYPYQDYPEKGQYRFYNGMTMAQASDPSNLKLGVHNFANHPITSRAHLLDIPRYLAAHSLPPLSPFSNTSTGTISASTLQACADFQGLSFLPGDILVVRTGYTEAVIDMPDEERDELRRREVNGSCGVAQGEEVLRWHWENGFAAVASDTVAYEAWPQPNTLTCHQVFLGGWGLPIGELFDLRGLAKACEELGRWTFFLVSMPLNVPGGIASPPNAQAIL
ncbi:hypothetical protein IAT38_004386 [Cryptococcus sp. DSM 104549]